MSLLKIIHMYIITLIVTVNNNKNIIIETDHLRAISPGLEDSHTFNRQGRSVGERILKSFPSYIIITTTSGSSICMNITLSIYSINVNNISTIAISSTDIDQ